MKVQQLTRIIGGLAVTALVAWLPACVTHSSNMAGGGDTADTEMERALVSSGFKVKTATTDGQRNHIRRLPDTQLEVVEQNGKKFYLYADKREDRLYVGDEWAYRAYRGYLKNQDLRKKGVFVWEVHPGDKANNKTVEVWHGWTPFPEWSPSRTNE
jgi:hypothetical protein